MVRYSFCSLYSGSNGNAMLLQTDSAKILIDAGKSARSLCCALDSIGVEPATLDAIFITHEHNDHVAALQVFSHKYSVPIYIIYKSALIFSGKCDEKLCACLNIQKAAGFEADIGNVHVRSFKTHHDSAAACGYRFEIKDGSETVSLGYVTDCGYISPDIEAALLGCESVVLESNYDSEMLMSGPYPYDLKLRIKSKNGHLSNVDCAAFAAILCDHGVKNIMLAHLSQENNTPLLALSETQGSVGESVKVLVASQDEPVWLVKDTEREAVLC